MDLTDSQRTLLRTALGLHTGTDPDDNWYAPSGLDGFRDCDAMVAAGLMRTSREDGATLYHATVAGLRAVWGKPAIYEQTGDEVTARETEKRIHIYWQGPPKGRFQTGEIYRVSKSTVRWL